MPLFRMFISERPNARTLLSAGRHLLLANSRISELRDINYGSGQRQKLDIYEPAEINGQTEIILFIHGGDWETGNKDLHRFIGRSWANHNYVVILPNYRLAPDAHYPDRMEDVSESITWTRKSYDQYNGSIYLAGHSAGVHLAALAGFSETWRKEAKLDLENISGFILMAGVYQFYPFEEADKRVKRFIGGRRYWEEAQPFNHLKGSLPPVFISHGEDDEEVLPK